MPIVLVHESITKEQYEESIRRLTGGADSVTSPSDWPVEGLLVHAAGEGPNGFRVVDVWKSQEALEQFGARLMPILADLGVQGEPEIYPTLSFVSA